MSKRVLVVGDSCQDVFRYGKCDRLCPEAPVPIFLPIEEKMNGGMVINVLENIKALGADCDIITNDIRPVKTRLVDIASNQLIVRIDDRDSIKRIDSELMQSFEYDKYDAVVISDYNKGFLTENDINYIIRRSKLTFLDTKKKLGSWVYGVNFIKINENEFHNNIAWFNDKNNDWQGNLIMTKGDEGAILNMVSKYNIKNEHPVRDLSGAGDTFLAGLVVDYIKNNDITKAIRYANKCASWVVSQKGVAVVKKDKI